MWQSWEQSYIQEAKLIDLDRGLGKTPYPTLNRFINSLTSLVIREDE